MKKDTCRLCRENHDLINSHIVPKFIFKWLKDTSATGRMRSNFDNINKRAQDGLKSKFLCKKCELTFSAWEKYFSEKIFKPLANNKATVNYNENFLKFGASLSWRILKWYDEAGYTKTLNAGARACIPNALNTWRQFMLDGIENPREHEIHFFNFSGKIESNKSIPANLHRYLQRSIDIDIASCRQVAIVYAKMPCFLFIGYFSLKESSAWRKTRIKVKKGTIEPMDYNFPYDFWQYIGSRAERCANLNNSLSKKQQDKINEDYRKNLDRATISETWKSLERDIDFFGLNEISHQKDK